MLLSSQAEATNLHDGTRSFEDLLDLISQNSSSWNGRLRGFATDIFWSLVVIQMVWKFGMMALKQPDWTEFSAEFFRFSMVVGFFHALLLYSSEWSGAIIDSFRQAGAHAAGVGTKLMPGDMFGLGVKFGKTIGDVQTLNPVVAFTSSIAAMLVLLCFVFIAGFVQVTLIEAYFVINASVFFMGFGGSEWTREYAMAMLRYAVAVGAKLLVLTLIVGLIMSSAQSWQAAYNAQHDSASMWTMVGLAFVCAYLSKTIPDVIQGLITGVSVSGGSALGGMAATMAAGVAGGIALASAKMGGLSGLMGGGGSGGGVADLLRSGSSGGGSGGGGYSHGFNTSPPSGGGGGGGSSARGGTSSRTGGGSGGAPSSGSSSAASSTGSAAQSSVSRGGAAAVAHAATAAAVKTGGVLSAIAVPGMESTADLSIGPAPTPPDFGPDTPENVIRPEQDEAEPAPKSMADLKESLNNRGGKA